MRLRSGILNFVCEFIDMIRNKKDLRYYLEQDALVNGVNKNVFSFIFPNKITNFLKSLRYLEYYSNSTPSMYSRLLWIVTKIRYRRLSYQLGFSIPINVFGPGLSIPHYDTIVVNPNARIGANCRLHVGVNIGASSGRPEAPQIGNNVYIGPGAILFGNITIADNVTIGANATVNKSCDVEYAVLAGTPAKIVKTNSLNWVQFNKVEVNKDADKRL